MAALLMETLILSLAIGTSQLKASPYVVVSSMLHDSRGLSISYGYNMTAYGYDENSMYPWIIGGPWLVMQHLHLPPPLRPLLTNTLRNSRISGMNQSHLDD